MRLQLATMRRSQIAYGSGLGDLCCASEFLGSQCLFSEQATVEFDILSEEKLVRLWLCHSEQDSQVKMLKVHVNVNRCSVMRHVKQTWTNNVSLQTDAPQASTCLQMRGRGLLKPSLFRSWYCEFLLPSYLLDC